MLGEMNRMQCRRSKCAVGQRQSVAASRRQVLLLCEACPVGLGPGSCVATMLAERAGGVSAVLPSAQVNLRKEAPVNASAPGMPANVCGVPENYKALTFKS